MIILYIHDRIFFMVLTFNELKRLSEANKIINRSSKRLGIKPLMINDLKEELKNTARELRKDFVRESKNKSKNSSSNKASFFLIVFLLGLFLFGFYFFQSRSSTDFDKTKLQDPLSKVQANFNFEKDSELLITKGMYKNRIDAEKSKRYLERRIGGELKVINTGNYFTVQLGPNYKNPEDAFIVFDELTKYGLKELSINTL
jgi:hypothetical protein